MIYEPLVANYFFYLEEVELKMFSLKSRVSFTFVESSANNLIVNT